MKKIVLISSVLMASVLAAGSALAAPPIVIDFPPGFPGNWGVGNHSSSSVVGEEFNPFAKVVDVRTACIDAGGTPIRQIEDNGTIGYRCYIPKH